MAIPNTENIQQLFVTRQPSWELGVVLTQAMLADVQTMRSGLEQRQARMSRGRWAMEYSAHLSAAGREARMQRILAEVAAPLQVPFWPLGGHLTTDLEADAFTMDRDASEDYFLIGDWVFLLDGSTGSFRQIAAADGPEIELEPDGAAADIAAGAWVFPCKLCIRDGVGALTEASADTIIERLVYNQL